MHLTSRAECTVLYGRWLTQDEGAALADSSLAVMRAPEFPFVLIHFPPAVDGGSGEMGWQTVVALKSGMHTSEASPQVLNIGIVIVCSGIVIGGQP